MHITEFEALDLVLFLVILGIAIWVIRDCMIRARRKKLMEKPFPEDWRNIIKNNVHLYNHLPEKLQNQLHGLINIFLDEKEFEGCGGLEITDEIRVTIAAQACMLLLNRKTTIFPKLSYILVYPSAYVARGGTMLGGQYVNDASVRLGESWLRGSLVLSWDHACQGAKDIKDGDNVVLHEFAHQLDQESGYSDGIPPLEQRSSYVAWARILGHEYQDLRYKTEHHKKDVLNAYGATNPAEFFAVATETFFEKSKKMQEKHPELYNQLKKYYRLDPLDWKEQN